MAAGKEYPTARIRNVAVLGHGGAGKTSLIESMCFVSGTSKRLGNVDDDTAGITVSNVAGDTTEAFGTTTFTVVLDSEPTASVDIDVASDTPLEGLVTSAGTLTFTAGNWNVTQTVTVTGVSRICS